MKGKLLVVSSAILLTGAVIGTSIAVWANGNDHPFDDAPSVTPTVIDPSSSDTAVLSWGDNGLINIDDLHPGEEKGPYTVGLKADTSNGESFASTLSVSVVSTTSHEYKLIDYLNVEVYEETTKVTEVLSIKHDENIKNKSATLQLNDGEVKNVYFFISLEDSAIAHIDQITDEVTITVDLSKADTVPTVSSRTYYFHNVDSWSHVYAYAWNNNGKTTKSWPGVEMVEVSGGIFAIDLEEGYQYIIFSDGGDHRTETLTIDADKPYYDNGVWKTIG